MEDATALGIIPAHAGKTVVIEAVHVSHRDHPRSRGENRLPTHPECDSEGSSPLTRGKRDLLNVDKPFTGIIPAHAGKTRERPERPRPWWDHPRSRGENGLLLRGVDKATGSSPLTRGKPPPRHRPRDPIGIIPAHAGKTCSGRRTRLPAWDHPRSRGENVGSHARASWLLGSSPLTRGKQLEAGERGVVTGIIPAHAGKTVWFVSDTTTGEDHPRSRGENLGGECVLRFAHGSSPLTRGKLQRY